MGCIIYFEMVHLGLLLTIFYRCGESHLCLVHINTEFQCNSCADMDANCRECSPLARPLWYRDGVEVNDSKLLPEVDYFRDNSVKFTNTTSPQHESMWECSDGNQMSPPRDFRGKHGMHLNNAN